MKICWIDTETTGLSAYTNDVIQIGMLIEINGKVIEEFKFECQPHDYDTVQAKALEVNHLDLDIIRTFADPVDVRNKFENILGSYVDRFNKNDKFIMAGYNVGFDFDFMQQWWKKGGGTYWGSFFKYKQFDVYPLVFMYAQRYGWNVRNHKLETLAPFLGIDMDAHDALEDIQGTRAVYQKLIAALPEEFVI